jgi:hypothetical protein
MAAIMSKERKQIKSERVSQRKRERKAENVRKEKKRKFGMMGKRASQEEREIVVPRGEL